MLRIKKFDLYNQGIITLDQIDLNKSTLNSNQKLQVKSEVEGKPHINKDEIKKFLNNLKYPLYFLDFETINKISINDLFKLTISNPKNENVFLQLKDQYNKAKQDIIERFEDKVLKIRSGDDLLPSVMKMVKVFVAIKRRLRPGDKMSGRHGNKGVVSKIVPVEDMPYREDGRPVDIVSVSYTHLTLPTNREV